MLAQTPFTLTCALFLSPSHLDRLLWMNPEGAMELFQELCGNSIAFGASMDVSEVWGRHGYLLWYHVKFYEAYDHYPALIQMRRECCRRERENLAIDCSIDQDKIAHIWRKKWNNMIIFMNQ